MANKRDLKRTINYITSELFAETVAASLYNGKPTQEDVASTTGAATPRSFLSRHGTLFL
jgi:hypothetical protein